MNGEPKANEAGTADHSRTTEGMDAEWFARLLEQQRESVVYFLGWEGGPIKIGYALNVQHRLHQVQVHCPFDVKVLATRKGGADLEAFYHRRFADYRLRGEWFDRGWHLMQEIGKLNRTIRGHPMIFPERKPR